MHFLSPNQKPLIQTVITVIERKHKEFITKQGAGKYIIIFGGCVFSHGPPNFNHEFWVVWRIASFDSLHLPCSIYPPVSTERREDIFRLDSN